MNGEEKIPILVEKRVEIADDNTSYNPVGLPIIIEKMIDEVQLSQN